MLNSSKSQHRILYVTRISKGGMAVVLDQLVRGLDKNLYEPVVLFDTTQTSEIRKNLINSHIKTIELIASRNLQDDKISLKLSNNKSTSALLKGFLQSKNHYLYLAFKNAWNLFFQIPKVYFFLLVIRRKNIDLIHTHSDLRHGKPEILAAKIAGIPCITHRHNYVNYTSFDKFFGRFVTSNIYISNDVAKFHITRGESPIKGKIIHNGIKLDCYSRSYDTLGVRKEFDCMVDQTLIGHVARLDWWKGHEFFLEALAEVSKMNFNVKGLIVGGLAELCYHRSRRYLERLRDMAGSLGLEGKIIFTGHRNDVPRILNALDIVVHASSTPEPFGLTVIEGMAAAKPVIATAAGGVLDIIEDGVNGILIPCKDSKAMANAIVQIISDRDKSEQMGIAARRCVAEKYTLQQQVTAVQKLYDSILCSY
jgi:glycosyltransferase involved in cell wall biosynthesis